jgi:hypothetical protein
MAAQTVPWEMPLIWDIVVVVIVLHLGAFVRARALHGCVCGTVRAERSGSGCFAHARAAHGALTAHSNAGLLAVQAGVAAEPDGARQGVAPRLSALGLHGNARGGRAAASRSGRACARRAAGFILTPSIPVPPSPPPGVAPAAASGPHDALPCLAPRFFGAKHAAFSRRWRCCRAEPRRRGCVASASATAAQKRAPSSSAVVSMAKDEEAPAAAAQERRRTQA